MADRTPDDAPSKTGSDTEARRREALVRIGRYTAYATPIVLASMSARAAAPVSGSPPPPLTVT